VHLAERQAKRCRWKAHNFQAWAKLGLKTAQVLEHTTIAGYIKAMDDNKCGPTTKGEQAGIEYIAKSRFGPYFLWRIDVQLS